jgi:beta-1,4-mannosyltransferase
VHSSSPNFVLQMKVVDMFGSKMPVCTLGSDCLHELVNGGNDENDGPIFNNAEQLASQLEVSAPPTTFLTFLVTCCTPCK